MLGAGQRLARQESIDRGVAGLEDHEFKYNIGRCCRHGWWHSQGVMCVAGTLAVAYFYIKMPAVLLKSS